MDGGLRIEFANTLKDMSALGRVSVRATPGGRLILHGGTALFVVSELALKALDGKLQPTLGNLVAVLLPAALFYLILPVISGPLTAAYYRFGKHPRTFGPHVLALTNDGLREDNPAGALVTRYGSIERIVENGDYFFIFVGPVAAHVVPKRRLTHGDLDHFMSELQLRIAGARS